MLKVKSLIGALVWSFVSSAAVATDDPVKSFEKFVSSAIEATNTTTSVFFNKRKNGWSNQRFRVTGIKYDVKKTDSLVTPIVGVATFNLATETNGLHQSQGDAEASVTFDGQPVVDDVSLTFAYKNEKWELTNGSYKVVSPPLGNNVFEIAAARFEKPPYKNWIPK